MAELPDLGQQCSSCRRLDFLPIVCVYCKSVFCKDHLSTEIHKCPDFIASDRIIKETPEKLEHERCDFCSEIVKNRLEMVKCDHCQSIFCLAHRHPEGHNCSPRVVGESKTPSAHQLILAANSSYKPSLVPKGQKGAKNEALARKVALMKLKQTATGSQSIPQSERLYFNLNLNDKATKQIFLSSFWSVGKAVDFISSKFNLVNNNNKAGHPKLVIVTESESLLPFDLSLSKAVEQGDIESGQTLYMKYIDTNQS
uniref:AN1-type domain-containing protein n=1 Tax=Tetranychus urticae TaxID=32264 RepID=T1K8J5_TETUR